MASKPASTVLLEVDGTKVDDIRNSNMHAIPRKPTENKENPLQLESQSIQVPPKEVVVPAQILVEIVSQPPDPVLPNIVSSSPSQPVEVQENPQNTFEDDSIQMVYISEEMERTPIEAYEIPDSEDSDFDYFKMASTDTEGKGDHSFLDPKLIKNLNHSGFKKLRPIQLAVMTSFFTYPQTHPDSSHADILATSATGSGKSGAYLIPIIQRAIERSNIWTAGKKKPMALIFANSGVLIGEIFKTLEKLAAGTKLNIALITKNSPFLRDTYFDIGVCTIGRFKNHYGHFFENVKKKVLLNLSSLEYIVIDEADKMGKDASFLSLLKDMKKEAVSFGF